MYPWGSVLYWYRPPWGNEAGEVAVVGVKGNIVVAVPTVKDSLLGATG